ncbi:fibroblast growth factor receptor 3-like [Oscarella lobularis]|uniref:fibroblast growth factor receptor 3-like n=1 Tax=Oscarella lobularis TaxID=121494 RepID=UPI003313969B
MNFSSLVLAIGYLLLSIGSSPVRTFDCHCKRIVGGKEIRISNEPIRITKGDIIDVLCYRPRLDGDGLTWESGVTRCKENNNETCWTYVSKLASILTIKSATIDASEPQFACRLEDVIYPETCCTVNVQISNTTTNNSPTTTITMSPTTTPQRERPNSTTTYSPTGASTTHPYINVTTSFLNISSGTFTSPRTATISATVCVTAALLIGVGVAVMLKRMRLSDDDVTSNDSTDNLTYLLDIKEQQIWNGDKVIPIGCLSVGKSLGEGQFGTVAEGTLRSMTKQGEVYDRRIAIKMLRDREGVNTEELRKEAEFIVNLGQNPNVILVYGYCIEEKCVSKIVMEYAELGDLHRFLRKSRSVGIDDNKQFAFAQQIAEGMKFVVSKGCVHRDLAARNVLVCAGQRLKISDFGLAKDLQSAAYYRKTTRGGVIPFRWCAPEVLLYRTYSEYSDVWSYGIVLWEIATLGGTPYPGIPVEKLFELLTGKSDYRMSKPRNCSQKLYDVMVRCWNTVPDTRPTFSQITSEYMQIYDV